MLGRKTGACKEILFSPRRSYMFFNLLRCFGLQWSRKHLIFLLVAPPPESPASSMRGAGALTCFLASVVLLSTVHVAHTHTHTNTHTPSLQRCFIFHLPSQRQHFIALPACAGPPAAAQCILLRSCSFQGAVLPLLHQELGFHQSQALKQCALRSLSP